MKNLTRIPIRRRQHNSLPDPPPDKIPAAHQSPTNIRIEKMSCPEYILLSIEQFGSSIFARCVVSLLDRRDFVEVDGCEDVICCCVCCWGGHGGGGCCGTEEEGDATQRGRRRVDLT